MATIKSKVLTAEFESGQQLAQELKIRKSKLQKAFREQNCRKTQKLRQRFVEIKSKYHV